MRTSYENKPFVMYFDPHIEFRRPKKTHMYVEGLNNLVKYLLKLRGDGLLNNDGFGELVKMVSIAFIEAEISDRVENVLENKAFDDLLLGFWK